MKKGETEILGLLNPRAKELGKSDEENKLMEKLDKLLGGKDSYLDFLDRVDEKIDEVSSSNEKFEEFLKNDSLISKVEFNELIRIVNKYWNLFKNGKPIVLTISPFPPAIKLNISKEIFNDFNTFFKYFKNYGEDTDKFMKKIREFIKNTRDFEVYERIPPEYILKYEYVR